ncbi:MAG: endonuclease MutS2 [Dehalococcoidia bacterium]|nr:endonuclease MutS2 [Dehalococcoidia bacterium]
MDSKDLELLEFPRIKEIIAGYTSFSLSRGAALELEPSSDFEEVEAWLAESTEARRLLEGEPSVGVSGIEDLTLLVRAAARGRMLDTQALNAVRVTLEVLRDLRERVIPHAVSLPRLAAAANGIAPQRALEKAISSAVSPDGELLSEASATLARIRNRQRSCRTELLGRLQAYVASDTGRRYVQEPIVTEREGRFVIPVRSEFRSEIKGIVHDVSNSGASLFVEPFQTLEMGNELKELQAEEQREIDRILAELSAAVGDVSESIVSGIKAAAHIDLALAKARFAARFKAVEVQIYRPSAAEPPAIHLENARHPLLGDAAVPINIDLGRDWQILLITGPNTGGKTVALKTIGLLCAMTQAGLPIPALPASRLPVFNGIFADIGDEQSITQTLSTFGWHMSNISRILNTAAGYNLALLDELGASTDPQEGAALGRAILLYLMDKRFLAAVTTHYTELKVFAHVTGGMENASFDFDPRTLTPTYHLTLGVPGGSNAIATAARFGLPEEIVLQARASLSEGNRELETLLVGLQSEKQQLADVNKELARERGNFQSQNVTLAAEIKKLRDEKKALVRVARDEVVAEVAALQKEIEAASAELKKETSRVSVSRARDASKHVRERLGQGVFASQSEVPDGDEMELIVGDNVWLNRYEVKGVVGAIDAAKDEVDVLAGALRFVVSSRDLRRIAGIRKEPQPAVKLHTVPRSVPMELDLRGKRAEEAASLLDAYLSDAAVARLPWVRVIHGYGTGAVRSVVYEVAEHHPLVKSLESAGRNEGGDGAAILTLK